MKVDRRAILAGGAAAGLEGLADSGDSAWAQSGASVAMRVLPDGWTVEIDFAGLGLGRIEPTRLALRVSPPAADFLGVDMTDIGARAVSGAKDNINPWYDGDHPFPAPRLDGGRLTIAVRLDRPVRAGERVEAMLGADLVAGARSGRMPVDNRSRLLVCRHAQDRYVPGDAATLLAEVDCLTGCRIPDEELTKASELPTRFDANHPRFPGIAFDPRLRRVVVGMGAADQAMRVLAGIDLRADESGGYFILANAPKVIIRDCLFDDANLYCVSSNSNVTRSYHVLFNEMRGALERTRGDFSALPQSTKGHAAFFMRHKECESVVRLNRIHGSTNDGIIIMRGVCAQNAVYSQGWDNRPSPGHADGIWAAPMTPEAPKIVIEGNFVDSRDPGHGFNSITGSFTFALPPTQSHSTIPTGENFHDGLVARRNLMLSHRISWNMVDGISGPNVPNDRRYVRRLHVHDNWFTAPFRNPPTTPLYPWRDPNMRWSPDARWINNVDPTSGKVWVMGPQPRDMLFSLSVAPAEAAPGDVVTWTLAIDRYLAQYGPVKLALAESGIFADRLEADVAAAIAGYDGAAYSDGMFTFSRGLVGREVGQRNEGVRLRIARRIGARAAGRCSLRISANSVGSIIDSEAMCSITR
jgi:hypothetical protein